MLNETTRKLDLYDLFSILLPGVYFILILSGFAPSKMDYSLAGLGLALIVFGYILGRLMHTVAAHFEKRFSTNHREIFIEEVDNPDKMCEETIKAFYKACMSSFELEPESEEWSKKEQNEDLLEDIYTLVRSYIHMDGRGRSRTFQALHALFRGISAFSFTAGVIYYTYGVLMVNNIPLIFSHYTPVISTWDISPYTAGTVAFATSIIISIISYKGMVRNTRIYVEYLITDMMVIENADYPKAVVSATAIDGASGRRFTNSQSDVSEDEKNEDEDGVDHTDGQK